MISSKQDDRQDQLRELLEFIVNRLCVTQVNLSQWMDISRPLVNKFLRAKNNENSANLSKLPIKREGLINLCERLINETSSLNEEDFQAKWNRIDANQSSHEDINPYKLRQLFGEIGVDELLETAGLLPEHTQVIRVTPERFASVAQVAALFELLTLDELIDTTQGIVSIVSSKVLIEAGENTNDALDTLIRALEAPYQDNTGLSLAENPWKNHPILGVKRRIKIVDKLKKASCRLRVTGKNKFTQKEAISLFLSIAIKEQIPRYPKNIHLRVSKFEIKTISHIITWEEAEKERYGDIYQRLVRCVYQEECQLKNPDYQAIVELQDEPIEYKPLDYFDPVRMTVVTSKFDVEDNNHQTLSRQIEWTYNSSSSIHENAISACGLLLGILEKGAIANIITNTKALDGSMNSLVEASVIIDQKYQGIWVDRDTNIATLQAFFDSARQWLGDMANKGEIDVDIYINACIAICEIRKDLYINRQRFQNFEFVNDNEQSLDFLVENSPIKSIGGCEELRETLQKLAKQARSELETIPLKKIYFLLRLSLYRCYFIAKLLLLRLENFQGNLSNAKELIGELENALEEDTEIKDNLIPIQALLQTERILFELSIGSATNTGYGQNQHNKAKELITWKDKIFSAIQPGTFYKDPGLDIYHALSEIYGNYARLDLYFSDEPEALENAIDNFLRAAHYALRIGYNQRASRWFALAGRIWLRLNRESMSKQALKIAKKLTLSSLTSWHNYNLRQAICSEINLLEGEILLVAGNKPVAGLEWYLKALKGAIYLRLKRRMCDALIGIARSASQIGDRSIKTDLEPIYSSLSTPDNRSTEIVFNLINSLWEREDNPRWSVVADEFAIAAVKIWQDWYEFGILESGQKPDLSLHPIAEKIKNGTIYQQVNL